MVSVDTLAAALNPSQWWIPDAPSSAPEPSADNWLPRPRNSKKRSLRCSSKRSWRVICLARIKRLDGDEGGDHQTQLSRVQNSGIALDHATPLEAPNPLLRSGCGQARLPCRCPCRTFGRRARAAREYDGRAFPYWLSCQYSDVRSRKIMLLDTASLYFRAFYGVPDSFRGPDGTPAQCVAWAP